MAVGTLVFGRSSYENVLCLGLLVDETGRKMSKHLGNVLEPIPLMEAHGADALRWFFAASGSPWGARRVGHDVLDEIVRKVLLTYWNTASFLVLYANAGGWSRVPTSPRRPRSPIGRCSTGGCSASCTRWCGTSRGAGVFDTAGAGRRLAAFIDDLSNWYVRRSRRRFWDGPSSADGAAAFATLYECVTVLTLLMAPITPFVTDYVWGVLRLQARQSPCTWRRGLHLTRRLSTRGCRCGWRWSGGLSSWGVRPARAPRCAPGSRSRRALIGASGFEDLPEELRAQIAAELNVARA